jgi:signal transduction histidine kinase/CheY-like chemotaxis protein
MKRDSKIIVPSRLMVVGLGTVLFVLCVTAALMLLPSLVGYERLSDRLVGSIQSIGTLETAYAEGQSIDRILAAIVQSNKTNKATSYLRFVDLDDGTIFTVDEKGVRKSAGRVDAAIWAPLADRGRVVRIGEGVYDIYRRISPSVPLAVNFGIEPTVAHEIEAQKRLSTIVVCIILATGIGILIMIWQTRQIEEAKGELELVLESALQPIMMVDNDCRLVFANEPARALLGHPKGKKIKNRPFLSLISSPEKRDFFEAMLGDTRSDLDELVAAVPGYPEPITYRASLRDVTTEVGRTFGKLFVLRDITIEKRLEDKQVSQTIHELKGMLGEVKGFIRQALTTMDGESQRQQRAFLNICLEKLDRSYNTVAAMVRSIVNAFKPHSLELRQRHANLEETLKSNVEDFRASLDQEKAGSLRITMKSPERLPTVYCDPNAISRVMQNLLLNAAQHCPDGDIEVSAEEKGDMVQVGIRDSGCGIPHDRLDRIFEPHESFRPGGSGLGLSICRDFIQAHGGAVWADSPGRNEGTSFFFTLPKSKPAILASDPTLISALESGCQRHGYYPVVLDDLLAATRIVAETSPNAVLLDLDMKDTILGVSLAYRLKKTAATAKVPIIAFASNLSEIQPELDRYDDLTIEACLGKDFDEAALGTALRTIEAYWYLLQSS